MPCPNQLQNFRRQPQSLPLASPTENQIHPLHEVVFKLKDGEISKPFEFQNNYFIFKLWEKSEKGYYDFENLEQGIKQVLVIEKRKELEETLKNELMEKSQLSVNERALKSLVKRLAKREQKTS